MQRLLETGIVNNILIIIAVFFLLFFIALFRVVIKQYRKQRSQLEKLSADLGGEDLKTGAVYEGETGGIRYYYQYYAGSRNSPSYFKVWIENPSQGEFKIAKESRLDSFFKRMGIAIEIQTGDSEFDRDYYIQTDSVDFTRSCLSSPENRQSIKDLFAMGYTHVTHDGLLVEAKLSPFSLPDFQGKNFIEATLKALSQISGNMPEEAVEYHKARTPLWKLKRNVAYGIAIASIMIGVALMFWAKQTYPPLDSKEMFYYSIDYFFPAFVLFLVVTVYWIKGRSSSHKDLLFIFAFALLGFPVSGYFGVMAVNGFFDTNQSTSHEVQVLKKRISQSKDSKTYYVKTKSWRKGRGSEEIQVTSGFYNKVTPKSTLVLIETKPGKLDFEWVVSYSISK